jgi:hypothetical protein
MHHLCIACRGSIWQATFFRGGCNFLSETSSKANKVWYAWFELFDAHSILFHTIGAKQVHPLKMIDILTFSIIWKVSISSTWCKGREFLMHLWKAGFTGDFCNNFIPSFLSCEKEKSHSHLNFKHGLNIGNTIFYYVSTRYCNGLWSIYKIILLGCSSVCSSV